MVNQNDIKLISVRVVYIVKCLTQCQYGLNISDNISIEAGLVWFLASFTAVAEPLPAPAVEAPNADVIGAIITGVLGTALTLVVIVDLLTFAFNVSHYIIRT